MGKRRPELGIIYSMDSDWIAGAYYLQNIVSSLNYLPKSLQPIVHIICDSQSTFNSFAVATKYQYLKFAPDHYSKFYILLKSVGRKFLGIPSSQKKKLDTGLRKTKMIYPVNGLYLANMLNDKSKAVAWIPDFQEEYLPELFSEEDRKNRKDTYNYYIKNKIPIVFSSNDALADFRKFYPNSNNVQCFVLPFSVFHPDFSSLNIDSIKEKYSVSSQYLFCANQFWTHKNHLFLFNAFLEAKQKGLKLQLVCSGKIHDYRDETYKDRIMNFIRENKLQEDIRLLGFISREEQLCLMKHSYAVIQPSLFEGWSTVVEDAKRLNKFVFLSNLNVHQEQKPLNACFFNPRDKSDLVHKLLSVTPRELEYDYTECIKQSADSFFKIINAL